MIQVNARVCRKPISHNNRAQSRDAFSSIDVVRSGRLRHRMSRRSGLNLAPIDARVPKTMMRRAPLLIPLARIGASEDRARAAAARALLESVWALRWSDANPERQYRLHPFGGRMLEMGRQGGFVIRVQVELGNMYGTPEYASFFVATVARAEF